MELIQKIKEAEKKADQIVEDAKHQAADLLEQAKRDRNEQIAQARRQRSQIVDQAVEEARAAGQKEADKLLEEGRHKILAMQTQARKELEPAIERVIGHLGD